VESSGGHGLEELTVYEVYLAQIWLSRVCCDPGAMFDSSALVSVAVHTQPGDQFDLFSALLAEDVVGGPMNREDCCGHQFLSRSPILTPQDKGRPVRCTCTGGLFHRQTPVRLRRTNGLGLWWCSP